MMKFIMTHDEYVAELLIKAGYKPLLQDVGLYVFANDPANNFAAKKLEKGSYVFTNKMFF